ncbi:uncharacterized protein IL334_006461 [Kwoniella shivajii]|uniref:Uncharacterized protein n=1 Tax=Kwoniella shivajii TaxID=564305 RepID=A0ABZ1D610_9TREE|nr:hypothetical protein IL334_006461 [Kwoniella shivajii]
MSLISSITSSIFNVSSASSSPPSQQYRITSSGGIIVAIPKLDESAMDDLLKSNKLSSNSAITLTGARYKDPSVFFPERREEVQSTIKELKSLSIKIENNEIHQSVDQSIRLDASQVSGYLSRTCDEADKKGPMGPLYEISFGRDEGK